MKPEEEQTTFELRWLTALELSQLEDNALTAKHNPDGPAEFRVLSGSMQMKALEMGLVGWDNFRDAKGDEIPFKRRGDKCARENIDYLHPRWRQELTEAITEMNEFTEEDEKK